MAEEKEQENDNIAKLDALDAGVNTPAPAEPVIEKPAILGWHDITTDKLPYEGLLLPSKYRYQVRAAKAEEIKHFSAMDETNPLAVNTALSYILDNCVRVLDGRRVIEPALVIPEHQRFYFVLLAHSYTGGTTELSFGGICENTKCRHKSDATLNAFNIRFTELTEKAKEYLKPDGHFEIPTKSLGTFYYRTLTLAEAEEISDYMIKCKQDGIDFEKTFMTFVPFLTVKRKSTETVKDLYQKYLQMSSDVKVQALIQHLTKKVFDIRQLLELETTCPKCKRPFRTPISSLDGLSDIFFVDDIASELS